MAVYSQFMPGQEGAEQRYNEAMFLLGMSQVVHGDKAQMPLAKRLHLIQLAFKNESKSLLLEKIHGECFAVADPPCQAGLTAASSG